MIAVIPNRGADPRARRMGAGSPADIRRAQSGPVPCSGAKRRGKALDEGSAAIPGDAVAGNAKPQQTRASLARGLLGAIVRLLISFHIFSCVLDFTLARQPQR
jgi:hypothetical protein